MYIRDILDNCKVADWEETSLNYCNLMIEGHIGKGGVSCIICKDKNSWEVSASIRYLAEKNIKIEEIIEIEEVLNNSALLDKIITFSNMENSYIILCHQFEVLSGGRLKKALNKLFLKRDVYKKVCQILKRGVVELNWPYWRERREEIYMYACSHKSELQNLADKLADDESRNTLYEIIRCSAENDIYRKKEGLSEDKYWECYKHIDDEVWVNCGSAVGDTIVKYLIKGYQYKKIYMYEGNAGEYKKLQMVMKSLRLRGIQNIQSYNEFIGVDESAENFDSKFKKEPITLINMDIEGAEMGVLRGAKNILRQYRPVLAVCAYHKATDLLDIPSFIEDTVSDYLLYLRKYRGYEPNALNEYLFYAVPLERKL